MDWSAQCRSSTTRTTDVRSLRRPSRPSSSSNSRGCTTWPAGPVSDSPRLGNTRASSCQDGPANSRIASTPNSSGNGRSLNDRGVRQPVATHGHTAAGQHPGPAGDAPSGQFGDQPGLADAGLTPTRTTVGSPPAARSPSPVAGKFLGTANKGWAYRQEPRKPHPESVSNLPRRLGHDRLWLAVQHRRRVEGEQPPGLGEALQVAHSQIDEPPVHCRPSGHGPSSPVPARGRPRPSPGCQVHADPCNLVPVEFHLAGVRSPARSSIPSGAIASTAANAARTAEAGASKPARNPSPAVSTSRPP